MITLILGRSHIKAIIYNMTNEIKNAFRRIENKDNFRDKLYEVLDIMRKSRK